jgi:hypothetical protein
MQLHLHAGHRPHVIATKAELRRQQVEFKANPSLEDAWLGIDVYAPGCCPCPLHGDPEQEPATPKEDDHA